MDTKKKGEEYRKKRAMGRESEMLPADMKS